MRALKMDSTTGNNAGSMTTSSESERRAAKEKGQERERCDFVYVWGRATAMVVVLTKNGRWGEIEGEGEGERTASENGVGGERGK